MSAYYNENDPFAAQWLRNLIAAGLIAPGDVDERSIVDVKPDDLIGYSQAHFFAGIGGWSYALRLAGWPDDRPVWTGSCPCQPFSVAGKQKGFDDERHLWPVWKNLIAECRPATVFGEQVASASQWLGLVRSDLEAMEYAVGAMPIQAASAGADHLRDRFWFVAHAASAGSFPGAQSGIYRGEKVSGPRHGEPERCGGVVNTAGVSEREPHHEGNAVSVGGQAWNVSGSAGDNSVGQADSDKSCASEERQQRSGQFGGSGSDTQTCGSSRDLAHTDSNEPSAGRRNTSEVCGLSEAQREPEHGPALSRGSSSEYAWVVGADGKARRVKPGVRLLVNGFPNRVGILRGFGNAIDPGPASQFILAAREAMNA